MTESEITDFMWSLVKRNESVEVRFLRGKKMRTVNTLFDEFSAALQFPYYFGENWNAFKECLTDLDWLPASSYILVITNADYLLDRDEESFRFFLHISKIAISEFQQRTNVSTGENLPLVSFHIIFQCSAEKKASVFLKLNNANVPFDELKI
jgi:hypothetical protein